MTSVLLNTIKHEGRVYKLKDRVTFLTQIKQTCEQKGKIMKRTLLRNLTKYSIGSACRQFVSVIVSVSKLASLAGVALLLSACVTVEAQTRPARPAPPRLPSTSDCHIQPYGDIGAAWRALPATRNPLGCPLEVETNSQEGTGRSQRFQFGQISWTAPSKGGHALLIAYQAGNAIEVQWTGLEPFHYDFFIVRTDKNGQNIGQQDVKGEPSAGWFVARNLSPEGTYRFVVEGCDERGAFGTGALAGCDQGWLNQVTVQMAANPNLRQPLLTDPPSRGQGCFTDPGCILGALKTVTDAATSVITIGKKLAGGN